MKSFILFAAVAVLAGLGTVRVEVVHDQLRALAGGAGLVVDGRVQLRREPEPDAAVHLLGQLGGVRGLLAVVVPSTAPSEGLEIVAVTSGLCVPHTWSSAVATVNVLLASPGAKVSVPLWPLADQLTVSLLATLSPFARVRLTVKVSAEPSVADPAPAPTE